MLKNHRTHATHAGRIRLGAALAALLMSALGYSLQVQAQPTAASVDLRLSVRDGETLLGEPRVITRDGQPAAIAFSPDTGSSWRIEVTPKALPDARYRLDMALYQGQAAEPLARPQLIVQAGQSSRVEIGKEGHALRIDLQAQAGPAHLPAPDAKEARPQ